MNVLGNQVRYASLSLKDLLDAREQYHVHLLNRQNVVGTAVGLYLIRTADAWPDHATPQGAAAGGKGRGARTFANSEVRPYSWPCILVLVDQWAQEEAFGRTIDPQEFIPKTLYLPDGRMVPVCVVQVQPAEAAPAGAPPAVRSGGPIGGGFPLVVHSQGERHVASVGGLVTDGHTVYALTSRHVCGPAGQPVSAALRGREEVVGHASALQLSRLPFTDVYPTFPGRRVFLNVDVGLVEVNDVKDWTSSVYGLDHIGPLADLNEQNLGFQLLDQPVRAFGAATGPLQATIKALFYRYRSVGGYDFVADLLLAPSGAGGQTAAGDSGTIWHLERTGPEVGGTRFDPMAVEWGGQAIAMQGRTFNFALASNLSNVCKLLDVELVYGHQRTATPFWGASGHYSIANLAVGQVTQPDLRALLESHASQLSLSREQLSGGNLRDLLKSLSFIPLADVPDLVWKQTPWTVKGGRDTAANTGPEHPTHYADMDLENAAGTLRAQCLADPLGRVTAPFFQAFYDSIGHHESRERGLLPLRVWQFYDAMVGFAARRDLVGFVAAAGTLAHYVGDACQPLHGSKYADGYQDQAVQGVTSTGRPRSTWPGKGVHSAFETRMIDLHVPELFDLISASLRQSAPAGPSISGGQGAAVATVQLMEDVANVLPPRRLCDTYVRLGGGASQAVLRGLWAEVREDTVTCMTLGVRLLARLWDAAWQAGQPGRLGREALAAVTEAALKARYEDPDFVPSLDLDHIGAVLSGPVPAPKPKAASRRVPRRAASAGP